MSYRDERRARGEQTFHALFDAREIKRPTPLLDSKCDFVFGEVWTRPGLGARERWLIALTCVGHAANLVEIDAYVHAVLSTKVLSLEEMREFVLHFAVYCGWSKAELIDDAVSRCADALGLAEPAEPSPLSLEASERRARGAAGYESVMLIPAPNPDTCYLDAGILNFVFGEMWDRPGLDRKSRRFITLAAVGLNDANGPIVTHVHAALKSGHLSLAEMREFVLQFAVYAGWPKASEMEVVTGKIVSRLAAGGSPFDLMSVS